MNNIKVLHNVSFIGKASYGLGQISVNLARSQYEQRNDVKIWSFSNNDDILWASKTHNFPSERFKGFELIGPKKLLFSLQMLLYLRNCPPNSIDIIHQHGIWSGNSIATLQFLNKRGIPTVIAPHGSLSKNALDRSKWKKSIALSIYERENLNKVSCLHATSEKEILDFRNFGLKSPIAFIENGINENNLYTIGNAEKFRQQNSITRNKRILLQISRITPKKGQIMLIKAIQSIQEDFNDWILIIAGNDEFNHQKEVENLIKALGLEKSIIILGPQFNRDKSNIFEAAELFILPSYNEGSPMVVLDSLAAGVPVITTRSSSWSDLETYNCGWWTEISQESISFALKSAISLSKENLRKMGENGKKLISTKYLWPNVAKKTIQLYSWLLKQSDKPNFVQID